MFIPFLLFPLKSSHSFSLSLLYSLWCLYSLCRNAEYVWSVQMMDNKPLISSSYVCNMLFVHTRNSMYCLDWYNLPMLISSFDNCYQQCIAPLIFNSICYDRLTEECLAHSIYRTWLWGGFHLMMFGFLPYLESKSSPCIKSPLLNQNLRFARTLWESNRSFNWEYVIIKEHQTVCWHSELLGDSRGNKTHQYDISILYHGCWIKGLCSNTHQGVWVQLYTS